MDNLLPTNEFTEVEGRQYINPQVSLDETTSFIDNLRSTQNQQNQEIAKQTNMLGTDVPSIKGGLIGADSYFTSRYQTPQTNAAISNLRATAQAQALNQALANEQAMWRKRYNDAYRNYQKRAASNSGTRMPEAETIEGGYREEDSGETTGLKAVQDVNKYNKTATVYDSTAQRLDSRGTEENKKIAVSKVSKGNVTQVTINGVPSYGRGAKAKYRYLKQSGLVR